MSYLTNRAELHEREACMAATEHRARFAEPAKLAPDVPDRHRQHLADLAHDLATEARIHQAVTNWRDEFAADLH